MDCSMIGPSKPHVLDHASKIRRQPFQNDIFRTYLCICTFQTLDLEHALH